MDKFYIVKRDLVADKGLIFTGQIVKEINESKNSILTLYCLKNNTQAGLYKGNILSYLKPIKGKLLESLYGD